MNVMNKPATPKIQRRTRALRMREGVLRTAHDVVQLQDEHEAKKAEAAEAKKATAAEKRKRDEGKEERKEKRQELAKWKVTHKGATVDARKKTVVVTELEKKLKAMIKGIEKAHKRVQVRLAFLVFIVGDLRLVSVFFAHIHFSFPTN